VIPGLSFGLGLGAIRNGSSHPPVLASIAPPLGPNAGGTAVTLTGSGFTGATSATVGGHALTSFAVVSDSQITGTTASNGAAANSDVAVNGPGGTSTLSAGFAYMPSGWTLGLYGEAGVTLSGSAMTAWADQSGSGNNFAQATGAKQPTFAANASNGFAAGRGGITCASGQVMAGPTLSSIVGGATNTPFTIYGVVSPTAARAGSAETFDAFFGCDGSDLEVGVTSQFSNAAIVDSYQGGDVIVHTTGGLTFSAPLLITAKYTGAGASPISIDINSGSTYTSAGTGTVHMATITDTVLIGGTSTGAPHANTNLQGPIAAVFAFNSALSAGDDLVVRKFFKNYYALSAW